jgi:hypothetical protein
VLGRLVPDLVRHRVGPVGEPGHGLGQGQRRPLGLVEVGRLPPGCDREQPLVGLALLLGVLRAGIDAEAAAVDLARPQVDEVERPRGNAVQLRQGSGRSGSDGYHNQ